MNNPFEEITDRLARIETYLASLKQITAKEADADELLNITDAANFISLKVPTLYSKASLGTIPCNKQAGRLYFLKSELTKWIQEGRRKTLSEQTAEALNGLSKKKKGVNNA